MNLFRKLWYRWARKQIDQRLIMPRHTEPNERNKFPGLAWDSPVRQLRMAEIAARRIA